MEMAAVSGCHQLDEYDAVGILQTKIKSEFGN